MHYVNQIGRVRNLRYSMAELLAQGTSHDRSFLVIYHKPSRLVEVALEVQGDSDVLGETVYQSWDKDNQFFVAVALRIAEL